MWLVNYGTAPAVAVVGVLIPPGFELRGVIGAQVLAQTPESAVLLSQRIDAHSSQAFHLSWYLSWSNIVPPGQQTEGKYSLGDPLRFPFVLLASPMPEAWDVVQQNSAGIDDIVQGAHWGSLVAGGYAADAYLDLSRDERTEYIDYLGDRYPYVADALVTAQLSDFGFSFTEKTGLGLEEFTSPAGFGPQYHGGEGTLKDPIQDAWFIMKATGVGAWEDLTSADRAASLLGFGEGFVEGVTFGFYRPNLGAEMMAHILGVPPGVVGPSRSAGNLTSALVPSGNLAGKAIGWGVKKFQKFIPRPPDIKMGPIKIALHGNAAEPVHIGMDWVAGGAERNIFHFGVHTQYGPHLGFGWSSELVSGSTNVYKDGLHLYPGHSFIPSSRDVNVGYQQLADGYLAYRNTAHPPQNPGLCNEGSVPMIRASHDPNHIDSIPMGPYILPITSLAYFIQFENVGNLEAQDVTLTLSLDDDLDLSTLTLEGSSHPAVLETTVDQNTRTITWRFTGINLPPNQNPPEGEGWVRFSIFPNADVPSGAEILHKATIVFDTNPPIETNESRLVVDREPPTSNVKPLQPAYYNATFSVPFDASDATSGLKTVELWYAEKPIEPVFGPQDLSRGGYQFNRYGVWESGTQEFQFTGRFGYEYRFFTMAFDQVGNAEWEETQIDALTSIPMPAVQVVRSTANIPTTAKKSDVNVPMLQFVVRASQSEGVRMEGLSLQARGDGDDRNDVLWVKVWVDANGNGRADDGGSPIAQGVFPANDGTLSFTLASPRTVSQGQSEVYLITYDFAQTLAFSTGRPLVGSPAKGVPVRNIPYLLMAAGFLLLSLLGFRRLRGLTLFFTLTLLTLSLFSACGGGGSAPALIRSYYVTLTGITVRGASSGADATIAGIPLPGPSISVTK